MTYLVSAFHSAFRIPNSTIKKVSPPPRTVVVTEEGDTEVTTPIERGDESVVTCDRRGPCDPADVAFLYTLHTPYTTARFTIREVSACQICHPPSAGPL